MNKERDIEKRWIIINRLFLFLGVAMLATVLLREYLLFRQNTSFFNDQLYEKQMLEITQEVDNRIEQIESTRLSVYNMFADEMEYHVELADFFASEKVLSAGSTVGIEERRTLYIDILESYNSENDEFVFFAFDEAGEVYLSDVLQAGSGMNFLDLYDPVTKQYYIRDFISLMETATIKNGFIDYHWSNDGGLTYPEMTSYIIYNEEVELFIGTGMYQLDYQEKMKEILFSEFESYYDTDDYVFVIGYDGEVLYHPLEDFGAEDLLGLETTSSVNFHQYILDNLNINEPIILNYNFNINGEDNFKTGYIRGIDEWNLYIGKSLIENDLKELSNDYFQTALPGFIVYNISMIVLFLGFAIVIRMLIYSNFYDVEQMFKLKNKQLKDLSFRDQLTHLYNRQMFMDLMPDFIGHENQIAILMLDANGLKLVNDTYGHKMGDELLVKLSNILREIFVGSYIFRWGGDEFVVVIKDAVESAVLEQIDRFKVKMSKTTVSDYKISAAIGFALDSASEDTIYEMLDQAEKMMYDEKTLKSVDIKRDMIDHLLKKLYEVDRIEMNHSENVVKYALLIGRKIELSVDQINLLRLSSLLHDVGKIGIPQDILLKESTLNKHEYELVRNHSEKGYRILSSYSQLSVYASYVLSHHEWYNGEGYPQGLKGEDIPLLSRIISIADAFDAMVSERTYHEKKTYDEAMNELMILGNIQFDLELVKIFKEVMPKELYLAMEDE